MHEVLAHYRAIHAAARHQATALVAGDIDRFLELLEERDALLARAEALGLPENAAERAEAEALLRAILDLDAANADALAAALNTAREGLAALREGARAIRSYRAVVERAASFIDRDG